VGGLRRASIAWQTTIIQAIVDLCGHRAPLSFPRGESEESVCQPRSKRRVYAGYPLAVLMPWKLK
jgi:hypothetical protein